MGIPTQADDPSSLAFQATQFNSFADLVRKLLQNGNYTVPTNFFSQLDQISRTASQLSEAVPRLEEEIQRLQALNDIGQFINSSLNIETVLRIAMDTIIQLTRAERGFLMLRKLSGELVIHTARNWEREIVPEEDLAISRSVIRRAINENRPVLTTNAKEDPRFSNQDSIITNDLRAILCVPMHYKDRIIGAVYADNRMKAGVFGQTERDLVVAFANQIAVAIENARLFESLRVSLVETKRLRNLQENVFGSIAAGVITTDRQDRITLNNPAASQILCGTEGPLTGKDLQDICSASNRDFIEHVSSVWKTEQELLGVELIFNCPVRPPVTLVASFTPMRDASGHMQGVTSVFEDITERKHLEAKRHLLERMISPAVLENLDLQQIDLASKRAAITTLFADIRGSTEIGEVLPPEKLLTFLNGYLSSAANVILSHQGTIDKFQGDAVMAWFNAPIPQPDHALRAVSSALLIQKETNVLKSYLPPAQHISFGMGIHTGEAILGMLGTDKRSDYTAVGDSINTAKRIQESAEPGQILISEAVYRLVKDQFELRLVGAIAVKGKRQPVQVYEVLKRI